MDEVKWGAATHSGRVRPVNEDSLIARPPIFAVADGMGGHADGDVASRLAVRSMSDLAGGRTTSVEAVERAVHNANLAIVGFASESELRLGMGTTITGVALVSAAGTEHWLVFNLGDSRTYRLVHRQLEQVTVDHSEVEELVSSGVMNREDAHRYRRRHVVTRSLGSLPVEQLDTWIMPPVSGERFLVCSDGLTKELPDAMIAEMLRQFEDPQLAANALVATAIDAGGSDNVTVLVVDGQQAEPDKPQQETVPRRKCVA